MFYIKISLPLGRWRKISENFPHVWASLKSLEANKFKWNGFHCFYASPIHCDWDRLRIDLIEWTQRTALLNSIERLTKLVSIPFRISDHLSPEGWVDHLFVQIKKQHPQGVHDIALNHFKPFQGIDLKFIPNAFEPMLS